MRLVISKSNVDINDIVKMKGKIQNNNKKNKYQSLQKAQFVCAESEKFNADTPNDSIIPAAQPLSVHWVLTIFEVYG